MQTNSPYPPIVLSRKRQIIDAAGYVFYSEHALYVNRNLRRAFSWQFLDDHTADEVDACVGEETSGSQWRFYFNEQPSRSVRELLEAALE